MASFSVQLGSLYPFFSLWCQKHSVSPAVGLKTIIYHQLTHGCPSEGIEKNPRIRIKLEDALSNQLAINAEHVGSSTAELVRHLVAAQLFHHKSPAHQEQIEQVSSSVQKDMPKVHVGLPDKERVRIEVSLSKTEVAALDIMAAEFAMKRARFILQIVRAYMLSTKPLSQGDSVTLGAINTALLKTGSNLNQIARSLNSAQAQNSTLDLSVVAKSTMELSNEIKQCVHQVARYLGLQNERWQISFHSEGMPQ